MKNPFTLNRTELIELVKGKVKKAQLDELMAEDTATIRAAVAYLFSSKEEQEDAPYKWPKPATKLPCGHTKKDHEYLEGRAMFREAARVPKKYIGVDLGLPRAEMTLYGFPVHVSDTLPKDAWGMVGRKRSLWSRVFGRRRELTPEDVARALILKDVAARIRRGNITF